MSDTRSGGPVWSGADAVMSVCQGGFGTDVRNADGQSRAFDLWTHCYSVGHLRQLAEAEGLSLDGVFGVEPGAYARSRPTLQHPELLVLATKD